MLILLYLAAIITANLVVAAFGPSVTFVTSFLLIGLDITTRDALHERWHHRHLWPKMFLLVLSGSALSYLLNRDAGTVAVASFVSFSAAGFADAITYHLLRRFPRFTKVNGSNVVTAAVDSTLFPTLAFGAIIPYVMLGQFTAKVLGGYVWSLVLRRTLWQESRERVAASAG